LTSALLIARFALAIVFFVAGVAKLFDRSGSRAAMAGFGLPKSLAAQLGVALPIVELLVAIALVPAASARWGAFGALVLLGVFVAGIANVMLRGREAECHCFGQLHSSRVGWSTLGRNLVLALVAAFVVAGERGGSSPSYIEWIGTLSRAQMLALFAGAIALALFAAGGWFMSHLLRQHGRLLLRLDTLEQALAAHGIITDPSQKGSADGLAPGVTAPSFALPNLDGATTTLGDLLAPGLPLMLVFSHPGCTPCVAFLPELGSLQRAHRADVSIALISEGSADENRGAAKEHGVEHILLQPGRDVAETYEAYGTPSAVLVSKDGIIASPVAQGAAAIRVLLSSAVASASADVNRNTTGNQNGNGTDAREPWRDGAATSMSGLGVDAN
jgi:peroxiredoxin